MIHTRHTGSQQHYPWLRHPREVQKSLDAARRRIVAGEFHEAEEILQPIAQSGDPEALYLGSLFSWKGETADAFDRRHLEWIQQSAKENYPPAIFVLAVYFDTGELITLDKSKASQLF